MPAGLPSLSVSASEASFPSSCQGKMMPHVQPPLGRAPYWHESGRCSVVHRKQGVRKKRRMRCSDHSACNRFIVFKPQTLLSLQPRADQEEAHCLRVAGAGEGNLARAGRRGRGIAPSRGRPSAADSLFLSRSAGVQPLGPWPFEAVLFLRLALLPLHFENREKGAEASG